MPTTNSKNQSTVHTSLRERTEGKHYDAVVVGSGPNGFGTAITLARKGLKVLIVEKSDVIGGGCRSAQLTLPGFTHDICSSIHPLGYGSPLFRNLPLEQHGLKWIFSPVAYAHPLDDGAAVLVEKSIDATAKSMGVDAERYAKLMNELSGNWDGVCEVLRRPVELLRYPLPLAKFGIKAMSSVDLLSRVLFADKYARAAFAGVAAHSSMPLSSIASASIGLVLSAAAHAVGWPFPEGGSQSVISALASYFESLDGEIITGFEVSDFSQLPETRLVFFDLTPVQVLRICGSRMKWPYRQQLRHFKYGAASFKLDWALNGPIPWTNKGCAQAATVHIGGTLEEMERSEHAINAGYVTDKPYVLLAQTSLFDPTRAPSGKHTGWAYCHVPNNSDADMTEAVENQIERFAPGFKQLILKRHVMKPRDLNAYNDNYVGGDINGGALAFPQTVIRPALQAIPYATSMPGVFICSSSTPPGSGVHGMCGYYAALAALKMWTGFDETKYFL